MGFQLRCSECRDAFPWKAKEKFPRYCPLCKADMGTPRADDDIVMPFIRSPKTKATDNVYREMERGSEFRAQAAAEMAGVPVSEMSGLKITDLNDRKDRESSAVEVRNPVTEFMAANPGAGGFRGGDGVGYSGAVQTGPMPNMGAKMRTALQRNHADMVGRHAVGRDSRGQAVRPSTDVVSDRPAIETTQPGYRRRG